ncbi:MAG: HAMP domain-containing histidine kinase [Myxococcota bacterium]|nr:HAMP domain-containing histidine kinase [Myxococcota bacterium]
MTPASRRSTSAVHAATGRRAPEPLSLRRLVATWSLVFGVLAVAVSSALAITTKWQRQSTEVVLRDSATVAITEQLERHLLVHSRLSHLSMVTGDPEVASARLMQERDIRALIERARAHIGGAPEEDALASVERELERMFQERAALERRGEPLHEVLRQIAAPIERTQRAIAELRTMNEREVRAAHVAARRVDDLSTAVGAAAALTLVFSLGLLLLGLHRLVLRPLDGIRVAIGRSRRGERAARAEETGPREIADIARAFNEASAALDHQHEDRIAFLGGVAHDLRNPLGAIKMALASARHDMPEDRRLAIAERQIDRLAHMIGDLLDAARIEAGELELHLDTVDLTELAREVLELYRPTTTRHTLELEAPDGAVVVRGDPLRLEQVIANLVTNAVKYSPEGGPVHVRVARREEHAVLAVADFGVGVPRAEIPQIFSPFLRRAATRAIAPGAGLGLSVVRRIVDAHGGSIAVDSTPHVGSTFTITLPAEPTVSSAR